MTLLTKPVPPRPITTRAGITIGSDYRPPRRYDAQSACEVQRALLSAPVDSAPDLRERRTTEQMHPADKSVLIGCAIAAAVLGALYAIGAV
jgi:hypothetical protein